MKRFGSYRVLERIGVDAGAELFVAIPDAPVAETVLLRVTPARAYNSDAARAEFAATAARYAATLHPALLQVYGVFGENNDMVVAMEHVEGITLDVLIRSRTKDGKTMPDAAALHIAACVFGALAAAHASRDPQSAALVPIAHGDVRPEAVVVPWDGRVRLSEFSATRCCALFQKTPTGPSRYAAPERAPGVAGSIAAPGSSAGDVYSAALMLWELLSKKEAFPASLQGQSLARALLAPKHERLADLRPDLPRALTEAIDAALQAKVEARTTTAVQVLAAIGASFVPEQGESSLLGVLSEHRARSHPPQQPKSEPVHASEPSAQRAAPREISGTVGLLNWVNAGAASEPKMRVAPQTSRTESASSASKEAPLPQVVLPEPSSFADSASEILRLDPKIIEASLQGHVISEPRIQLSDILGSAPSPLPSTSDSEVDSLLAPRDVVGIAPSLEALLAPQGDSPVPKTATVVAPSVPPPVLTRAPRRGASPWISPVVALLVAGGGIAGYTRVNKHITFVMPAITADPSVVNATVPTSPVVPVSATVSSVPAASATLSPSAAVAPSAQGTVATADARHSILYVPATDASSHQRIVVDGHVVGESPADLVIKCGSHIIKVGKGPAKQLVAPCGGSVSLK
jgi:serine/threonine protein kinase